MTIHAAKGLEFRIVFIIGLEDGLFPHYRVLQDDKVQKTKENIEEERRLFYVASTRSSEVLNMTYCGSRTCSFGHGKSRFLKEVKNHYNSISIKD